MRELVVKSELEELTKVLEFMESLLDETSCGPRERMQLNLAMEEMFVNIVNYAYEDNAEKKPEIIVRVNYEEITGLFSVALLDQGSEFDPLSVAELDVDEKAESDVIGGLGIYLVKESMDHVKYKRVEGTNIFVFGKFIDTEDM